MQGRVEVGLPSRDQDLGALEVVIGARQERDGTRKICRRVQVRPQAPGSTGPGDQRLGVRGVARQKEAQGRSRRFPLPGIEERQTTEQVQGRQASIEVGRTRQVAQCRLPVVMLTVQVAALQVEGSVGRIVCECSVMSTMRACRSPWAATVRGRTTLSASKAMTARQR